MEISSEKVLREIDSLKTGFKKKRIEIKNRFLKNNLGIKNCVENSDLIDSFIDQLYEKIKFLNSCLFAPLAASLTKSERSVHRA